MKYAILTNRKVLAALAVALAVLIVVVGYAVGMRGGILVAFAAGSILSAALGIGLMALIFYSNRSGYDEEVSGPRDDSKP
jgi:hypothetical protein